MHLNFSFGRGLDTLTEKNDYVVEVVLQKAAEVCESILRQHHNEETIPGRGVLKHANVLEESLRATSEKSGMMTRFFDRSISRLCVLRCSSVCATGRKTVMRIVTKTVKMRKKSKHNLFEFFNLTDIFNLQKTSSLQIIGVPRKARVNATDELSA